MTAAPKPPSKTGGTGGGKNLGTRLPKGTKTTGTHPSVPGGKR